MVFKYLLMLICIYVSVYHKSNLFHVILSQIRPPPIDYCSLSVEEILNVFNKLTSRQVEGRFVIKFS